MGGGIVLVLPLAPGGQPSQIKWNRGIQSLSRPAAASSLYTREPLRGRSHPARWGCRGCFLCFRWGNIFVTPDDFSLVPPGGTVSFCKKEMVGPEAPLLEGVTSAPSGRKIKLGPLRGKKRSAAYGRKIKKAPLRGAFSLLPAEKRRGHTT